MPYKYVPVTDEERVVQKILDRAELEAQLDALLQEITADLAKLFAEWEHEEE